MNTEDFMAENPVADQLFKDFCCSLTSMMALNLITKQEYRDMHNEIDYHFIDTNTVKSDTSADSFK